MGNYYAVQPWTGRNLFQSPTWRKCGLFYQDHPRHADRKAVDTYVRWFDYFYLG